MSVPGSAPPISGARLRLILAGLMVGLFLSELNETVFATALPRIVDELDGRQHLLWVNTAYLLTSTVVMPVYGMLGDRYGRRPLFVAALAVFLVGSLVGGVSGTFGGLVAGRAVQGLGGGGVLILIQAILADLVPARQRARSLTVVGAVFAASALLGPVLGGWLTDGIGWRWAFWLNLPLGAAALVVALAFLRLPRRTGDPGPLDLAGIAVSTLGVTALVGAASGITPDAAASVVPWLLAAVGLVALVTLVVVERRAEAPLIPPGLFARRNFVAPSIAGLVLSVAMFGTVGYLPTYLQVVHHLTPTRSGLVMLTLITGLALGTVAAAQITTRTGRYRGQPLAGSVVVAAALGALATLQVDSGLLLVGGCLFGLGVGIGLGLQTLVLVVQNAVPVAELGIATATHNFLREVGVVLGSALVGAAFTARLAAGDGPPDVAYHEALTPVFAALAPLVLLGGAGLLLVRRIPLATTVATGEWSPA